MSSMDPTEDSDELFSISFFKALYEQGEKLFEAIVRVRLISLIHLNTLVQSALRATMTSLAGGRYFQVVLKTFPHF